MEIKTVLVAEDEASIREFIIINLRRSGYEVLEAENGAQALEIYQMNKDTIDIALLDIMMPEVDGLEVCKQIRTENPNIGIIMLTARTQEMDKVTGLLVGADDYVTKPFSPSELMARVDVTYRRVKMSKSSDVQDKNMDEIVLGDFVLNSRNRTLTKKGKFIELTQVEFQIMECFFRNPDAALGRSDILTKVWGTNYVGEEKIVDVNIRRLRMKIEDEPSAPKHLITIWGLGYKWIV